MLHNRNCTKSLLLVAFLYGTAHAADVLPVGSLDTTSTGKVSSSRMLKPGEIKAATQFEGSSYVIGLSQFASEGSGLRSMGQEKLASSANRFSLFAGYGVTEWMDLHIGVRSSSEKMSSDMRRKFYLDGSPEGSVSSSGGGFGGAVASAKFELLSWNNLRIASLAFYESGVGDAAWQSVTRSEKDKLGLALISSYSVKSFGQILVNAGYRSRKAEEVGQLYLGNETFFKVSGNYHITPRFGTFLTLDSRSIRMADEKNPNRDGWLQYKNHNELGMELGLTGYVYGNYRMTGFIGGSTQKKNSGSSPERTFGLSLVVPIVSSSNNTRTEISMDTSSTKSVDNDSAEANNGSENSHTDNFDNNKSDTEKSSSKAAKTESSKSEGQASNSAKETAVASETKKTAIEKKSVNLSDNQKKQSSESYPEMQVKSSPVDAGIEGDSEFKPSAVDPKIKPTEDPLAAIENELKQIANDEAKAAEQAKKLEEENRKLAAKHWASNQKKRAKLERSIQRKVDRNTKDHEITDQDVAYKGLE